MSKPFKVTAAVMHQALIWPGVCPGDKTISSSKIKGLVMTWSPDEQVIRMTAKNKTEIVPLGSIANFSIDGFVDSQK